MEKKPISPIVTQPYVPAPAPVAPVTPVAPIQQQPVSQPIMPTQQYVLPQECPPYQLQPECCPPIFNPCCCPPIPRPCWCIRPIRRPFCFPRPIHHHANFYPGQNPWGY